MIVGYRSTIITLSHHKLGNGKTISSNAIFQRSCRVRCSHSTTPSMDGFEAARERIRETFGKVELSPSSYDTAWVAMVPSKHSLNEPCFPQCLDWIIENQREDGSWGLKPSHPLLLKDSLSSTLACLLALSKWRVGDEQIKRGLGFIETYGWAVDNKDQISPLGFEIIFSSMIKFAEKLNLNLPLDLDIIVNLVNCKRDSTIKRNDEYMGEGLGELCDWKEIIKLHQRQNGSLFDSPATTAAALIYHQHDKKCYEYLNSILQKHKNWVPTMYPTKIHSLLCLVDTLQNLGVHRHFKSEIKEVLDEIYRLWQQKNEEIFSNVTHCAMAFRLLRMSNYDVSSDELAEFVVEEHFFATSGKYTSHVEILELHKASQLAIDHEKDDILDKINNWTTTFMEQNLLNNGFIDRMSKKEVELALRKFYTTYDRTEYRRYIKSYEENNFKILKAAYRSPNINNKDLLIFSIHDFELCQAQHREELQQLKRWFEDCRLDQLGLSEQLIYTSYLICVAIVTDIEFSDARLMYAKYVMLLTVVDDLFESFASEDELLNIIELVERWDDYASVGYNSERVKVFFSIFYKSIEELATIAEIKQGRSVKNHLTDLWLEVMKWMLIERLEWWTSKTIPSIEEYLYVTSITFGSRLISLTTQYYLGIKISKDILESDEIYGLWNCSGRVMRLLNDLQASKREQKEGSINLVTILMTNISEEEAIMKIKEILESNRRELLKMVLVQKKGSQLPQLCKEIFGRTSKMAYFTYSHGDEYRFPEEMKNHIDEVFYKPLNH
ncbi:LOW QUALITY PROTEIN: beta-phellandrene synthase (neryl-diphosphate-cyclizing), chloroplastic-like [Solanum tuberosum]|uniref:LOW QUALITY PROTEIN: beta-phellandrene synthase (neryl-diphosphate-cyclizing), chloroplastic-like n=1 Tax=Solanum tuberosum TaxID=4113 RepID=UPI000739FC79|nr:PREDICTED: LOW QUALITY PROTEIN: beta-phellandrene synthase (neryl-diphosphate-cyclizing), chloroplastic-like [Solanum tuberosum]